MAFIDQKTKATVLAAVGDESVSAELAAFDITDQEVETLTSNLQLLAGAGGRPLWPDEITRDRLERDAMLDAAATAAQRIAASAQRTRGPVMRDSAAMILELVHVSGNPTVLADQHESWLWGPLGPPRHGDYATLDATERYPAHAAASGVAWDARTLRAVTRNEVKVQKDVIAAAAKDLDNAEAAINNGYGALLSSADILDGGFAVARDKPDGPWPTAMADWSDLGWKTAATLRESTLTLLTAAAAAGVITVLQEVEGNEERGILVPVARARLAALRRWWDMTGPARPPRPPQGQFDVSFWIADCDPAAFWAATMTAAWLECGRNRRGGPVGMAETLLGR